MKNRQQILSLLLMVLTLQCSHLSGAATYDVLNLPSVKSAMAEKSLIYTIRQFGERHYATGVFGHILYSDDSGDSWVQAEVPVRSSITDIFFYDENLGWAVGHEGVILHSSDGGETWAKQYDGLRYGDEGLVYYKELAAQYPDDDLYPYLIGEMEFAISQGADKPLFRVGFHTEKYGHVLGAYGMLLKTEDGGKTWEHQLHATENDSFYHLFDFAAMPEEEQYLLAGEAGLFMVGDAFTEEARLIPSVPWQGSFFTSMDAADGSLVVGGLRGRMFRTEDMGYTWTVVEKPPTSSIVGSTRLSDGRLVFVGIAGEILVSENNGLAFTPLPLRTGNRIYAVAEGGEGSLLVGGPAGIQKLTIPAR